MVVQAGLHFPHFLAKSQHRTELIRFDAEEAGKAPEHQKTERDQCKPPASEIAAGQVAPQFVLAASEDFLQVRRRRSRRLRSGAPRPLAARTPRAATALIAPWHCNVSRAGVLARLPLVGRGYRGRQAPLQRAAMPHFIGDSLAPYIRRQREIGVIVRAGDSGPHARPHARPPGRSAETPHRPPASRGRA